MTRRTYHGLTLTHEPGDTRWLTLDGRNGLIRARALSFCDNPHPERYRADRGGMMRGYCPGGQEHDMEVGWDVLDAYLAGLPDDLYQTRDEAWEALAGALRS